MLSSLNSLLLKLDNIYKNLRKNKMFILLLVSILIFFGTNNKNESFV